MKQSTIFGVTEITLDATYMATHQLKNVTAPIMTCGYRAYRSVWTQSWVRSTTRCVTKLILNCRYWDQSLRSYPPVIFARTKKQPCVWVAPIPKYNLWESARIPFMQTLLTKCHWVHRSPDSNVIVNVYIYTATGIKEIWVIPTVWMNFI